MFFPQGRTYVSGNAILLRHAVQLLPPPGRQLLADGLELIGAGAANQPDLVERYPEAEEIRQDDEGTWPALDQELLKGRRRPDGKGAEAAADGE